MTETFVIGIDCATEPARTGVAFGVVDARGGRIEEAALAKDYGDALHSVIARRCRNAPRVLLALDSPLGWPAALGQALAPHRAGAPLPDLPADRFFVRQCDQFVQRTLHKKPLEVGADRIARTARRALQLLAVVGAELGVGTPLAWDPAFAERLAAIEVYPAALLIASGLKAGRYKRATDRSRRGAILDEVATWLAFDDAARERALDQPDVLDAMLCVAAGQEFLAGRCEGPADPAGAAKEGWIWFPRPGSRAKSALPTGTASHARR